VSLLESSLDTGASSSSSPSTDYFAISQLTPDDSDSLLQNIQEIDYLAPAAKTIFSSSGGGGDLASRRHPRGRGQGHPVPIFQKVVLSREQLLERLEELGGLEDEEDEDQQMRKLRQLVEQTMQHS